MYKLQISYLPISISISLPAYLKAITFINLVCDQCMVYSFIAHVTIHTEYMESCVLKTFFINGIRL